MGNESDYTCGNCGRNYQINTEGERIQPCPYCGANEMVKTLEGKVIKKK